MTFKTPRLILTPMTITDAPAVYRLYTHPVVLRFCGPPPIGRREDTELFIRRITEGSNQVWCLRLREHPQAVIGDCALHHMDTGQRSAEIGGTLLPQFWGKGLMAEAFAVLLDYAAEALNLQTVRGRTHPDNRQAVQVVEKLGFRIVETDERELVLEKRIGRQAGNKG